MSWAALVAACVILFGLAAVASSIQDVAEALNKQNELRSRGDWRSER